MESKFQLTFDYNNVYNNNNPVLPGDGDSQPAPGKTYRVDPIGIVSPSNNEFSWYCLMDIEAVQKLAKENSDYMQLDTKNYNRVMVKCENTDVVSEVKAAIDEMGYGTSSLQDALEQAEKQMQQIQYLLGAIGGVSLLVAAIGIMNTMMMSIYERTKEIGIIKVLGCRMDNIAELFLTEAAYIGFFGGAAGLGISFSSNKSLCGRERIQEHNTLLSCGRRSALLCDCGDALRPLSGHQGNAAESAQCNKKRVKEKIP